MERLQAALDRHGPPLLGIATQHYLPAFADIVAALGFHILWIEMEHAALTFAEAGDLCRIAQGLGLLAMIRIPDASRENVLRAAECGPDIIDLPMANTPATVAALVQHGKYPPVGQRGAFLASRAVRYGMGGDAVELQGQVNRELCLMFQIETAEAVERADELCAVPGADAIFIGLGDLSASLGLTGQTSHPRVQEAARRAIAAARAAGRRVAMITPPADAGYWRSQGAEMLFCGNDVIALRQGAQGILAALRA